MIRQMTITDYPQVYELWKDTEGMDVNDIDESREGIGIYLERNPDTCFVEERDGKIVGVILAGHDGRRGGLHHLAVMREYRNIGIGKGLTKAAIDALKQKGIRRIGLFVYNDNEIGRRFWMKRGFTPQDSFGYLDKEI